MMVSYALGIVAATYSLLVLPAVAVMLWYLSRRQENKKVGRTQV